MNAKATTQIDQMDDGRYHIQIVVNGIPATDWDEYANTIEDAERKAETMLLDWNEAENE